MLQLLVVEGVDIGKVSLMVDPVLVAGDTKLVVEQGGYHGLAH